MTEAISDNSGGSQPSEIARLRQIVERQTGEIAELRSAIEELQRSVSELTGALLQSPDGTKPSPIRKDISETQGAVLQAILDLPEDAFDEAEGLIATLEGQPMTQAFCNSLRGVLTTKEWGVICTKCGKPSSLLWNVNKRYAESGLGQFSHSAPTPHGSLTKITCMQFSKKTYRKRRI